MLQSHRRQLTPMEAHSIIDECCEQLPALREQLQQLINAYARIELFNEKRTLDGCNDSDVKIEVF